MSQGTKLGQFDGDESEVTAETPSSQAELAYFRNVTSSVVQDALNAWSEIWGELDGDATAPDAKGPQVPDVAPGSPDKGFTPSCGWPAFLEKMWVLRQNLDFLSRFSRQ